MKCISNLIVSREQFELIRALKMLLWLVCSGLLGEGIRTLCLDIQVFYSEALQLINECSHGGQFWKDKIVSGVKIGKMKFVRPEFKLS